MHTGEAPLEGLAHHAKFDHYEQIHTDASLNVPEAEKSLLLESGELSESAQKLVDAVEGEDAKDEMRRLLKSVKTLVYLHARDEQNLGGFGGASRIESDVIRMFQISALPGDGAQDAKPKSWKKSLSKIEWSKMKRSIP